MTDGLHDKPDHEETTPDYGKHPDIQAFFQTCSEIILHKGVTYLGMSLLAGERFPDALAGELWLLTRTHQEYQVMCALLLALAKHVPSLDVPRSLREHRLDDALIATVLRLVREHHAELFAEHAEAARP